MSDDGTERQARRHTSPREQRRTRVLRPWRIALLLFAIALTVGTHWPRLTLSPEIPASDKTIHLLAFGGLTLLLWRSNLFGPRWLVALVALAWAALDEISQALPGLGRTVTWYDLVANICGVTCAMVTVWALRPLGDSEQSAGPNEARARLFAFTFDEMFASTRPWLIGAAVAGGSVVLVFSLRWILPTPRSVAIAAGCVAIIASHVLYLAYRRIFFRDLRRVQMQQPCLLCGNSTEAFTHRDAGGIDCGECGAHGSVSDYQMHPRPPLGAILRISAAPAVVACVGVLTLFTLVLLLPQLHAWAIATPSGRVAAPRIAQMFGRIPRELTSVIDLTVYMLLIAVVVRLWRQRFAAYVDRAVRCAKCGHDLHGTPVDEQGRGICGECGATFARH